LNISLSGKCEAHQAIKTDGLLGQMSRCMNNPASTYFFGIYFGHSHNSRRPYSRHSYNGKEEFEIMEAHTNKK
jgi:hypothetical protein